MFASLYVKLGIAAAIVALLAGAWWYINDHAFDRGAASQKPTIDALRAQVAVDAVTLRQVNAQAAENKALADRQHDAVQAAIDAVTNTSKATDAKLSKSIDAFNVARKTSACATAQEKICAALRVY